MKRSALFPILPIMIVIALLLMTWKAPLVAASAAFQAGSWSDPVLVAQNASAPVIVSDSSGTLHVFYVEGKRDEEIGPEGQAIMYTHSAGGKSWSYPIDILVSPTNTPIIVNAVIIDRSGYLHLLWSDYDALYHSTVNVTEGFDAHAWRTETLLLGDIPVADMKQDKAGGLHVIARSDPFTVDYLRSDDEGQTWSRPMRIESVVNPDTFAIGGVKLAVDDPEMIHMTWFYNAAEVNWNFWSVWYTRSLDGGKSWERKVVIAEPIFGASDVALDGQGNVHLVYGRNIGYPDGRWHQWSADAGETWSEARPLFPTLEPASGDTGGYGFATDSAGVLHMVNSFGGAGGEAAAYYLEWQGEGWSSPQLLMKQHAHFSRIISTLGNQLTFVAMDGYEFELWTQSTVVDAPAFEPIAVPQELAKSSASLETGVAEAADTVEYSATITEVAQVSVPAALDSQEPGGSRNNFVPLLFGLIAALLLIGFVISVQLIKKARHT